MTSQAYGKRVWRYFLLFFGMIAAVNAAMVTLAIRTHTGIVTEHPYEKGLAYNEVVQAEEKQQALGWKGTISYENGMLTFSLFDRAGKRIVPQQVNASISRPTQAGMDFSLTLASKPTPVHFPVKGLWEVRVDAVSEGVHFQQSKRIVVE